MESVPVGDTCREITFLYGETKAENGCLVTINNYRKNYMQNYSRAGFLWE